MRQTNFALALLTAAALAACGGNGSTGGDQAPKTKFLSQVTFGDSLADIGTYAVGPIATLGGGKFTINGDGTAKSSALTGKNWTELLAAQMGLPAPCAAQTGLQGDATKGFSVAIVNHAGCFGYAQGGARVTNPVGPHNRLTGDPLGALTVPVATQIANHLAVSGGKFSGTESILVMAGGNDALMLLGQLSAAATAAGQAAGAAEGARVGAATFGPKLVGYLAAGATNPQTAAQAIGVAMATEAARAGHTDQSVVGAAVGAAAIQPGNSAVGNPAVYGPMVAQATADATAAGNTAGAAAGAKAGADYAAANGPANVPAMGAAGAQLADLVKTQMLAKGANFVTVVNLPDVSQTPSGMAQPASTQALIKAMTSAFNDALKAGLGTDARVLYVDLFTQGHDQVANPAAYGLTNMTTPACGANALGTTSLVCNASNVIAGDVSHYAYADDVHPTPFEYSLIAKYVAEQMIIKGWL